MKKKTTIILLILALSIYASNINVQITAEENDYRPNSLELTPHDPIEITSDSDFEVFPGTGTEIDPYVIEGYNITTTDDNGIYITYTTKYFTVRNCYVEASNNGIYIDNVAEGTATVINNTCNNNGYDGIKIDSSGSSTVINNTCNNNTRGIRLYYSGSSTVTNNTCSNNNYGILLYYSGSSTVTNNTCNNNTRGIYLEDSGSSTVVNNTFTNCGLDIFEYTIDAYLSYTIENNWVNGKKLGFYTNLDSTIIEEPIYGQLILVNCTNVTVRDQILNNATIGLSLGFCTSSAIINNTCSNNIIGIYLHSSDSLTVINNTCSNNNYGIYLDFSDSLTVINNTCNNNNSSGIWLWDSRSSTVEKNTCNNNNYGINLHSSGSSLVNNNTCSNNSNYGINLYSSSGSTVEKNTCNNNNNYGIYLDSSDFCVVTYNLLQENENYGVYLESRSNNNLIHHNTFVDNNLGGTSQAYNSGTNNYWYDTSKQEGNYWSDWSGTSYYSIDGDADSVDLYPLAEPVESTSSEHTSVESTTDENPLNFTFALLILVVSLILTRIISKNAKKE